MSFDIAATPTLQAVATPDEELLAQTLQARVQEAIASAEQQRDAVDAVEAQHAAEDRLARLRKGERSLSRYSKETREQTASATEAALDAIIESAESNAMPDFKKLNALTILENHARYANRAIERLVEHVIPTAQLVSLRAEAFALMTRARGIEAVSSWVQRRPAGEFGGHDAGEALMALSPRPTAILVSEALQTIGLYRKLGEGGLLPGRDVSIIGVFPEARVRSLSPGLTSFVTDWTATGARLGEALIGALASGASAPQKVGPMQVIVPATFQAGESVHRIESPVHGPG